MKEQLTEKKKRGDYRRASGNLRHPRHVQARENRQS